MTQIESFYNTYMKDMVIFMFCEINSKDNPKIKLAAKLISSSKERKENNLFVVETVKVIEQAIICGIKIEYILTTTSQIEKNLDFFNNEEIKDTDVFIIKTDCSEKISDLKTSQGIFAVCKKPQKEDENQENTKKESEKIIALENIQDPGNLGTIIRTALTLGFNKIILSENTTDLYSPKMLRATMGAAFSNIIEKCENKNFENKLLNYKNQGFIIYAAILDDTSKKLGEFSFDKKSVIIIGNEGAGITQNIIEIADEKIIIPQRPVTVGIQSLNAASAAAIIMWEAIK